MRRIWWEMEDRPQSKKPEEITYHHKEELAPRLCESRWDQELARTNAISHKTPFWDGPTIFNSVQYHLNRDLSGPWMEHESRRNDEHLQIRMNRMEEEFQTSQIQPKLKKEELRRNHYETRLNEDDMYHLDSQVSREDKRTYVYIWQKKEDIRPQMANASLVIKRPKADTENIKKKVRAEARLEGIEVPEPCKSNLQKKWLERPIQKLRTVDSQAASQKWLKATMGSIRDPQETGLQGSTKNDQEDLLEDREQIRLEVQRLLRDNLRKGELEASVENVRRGGYEESTQNAQEGYQAVTSSLRKKGPEASKHNLQDCLEGQMKNLHKQCPEESRNNKKEWMEISKSYLQEKGRETSKLNIQEWPNAPMGRIQDLQERGLQGSTKNVQKDLREDPEQIRLEVQGLPRDHGRKGGLEASIENLRRGGSEESTQNVQEGLQAVRSSLSKKGHEPYEQKLQGWLEECIKNLPEECPEDSRKDLKEWLEISKRYLQEKEPEASKLPFKEWYKTSILKIQDLPETGFERSTQNVEEDHPEEPEQTSLELPRDHLKKGWHEASIKHLPEKYHKTSSEDVKDWVENLQQKRFEVSESSTDHVEKGRLEASLENLRTSGSETSTQNGQDGFQAVISRVNTEGPEVLNQNLQEWLEACIKSLQLPSNVDSSEVPPRSLPDRHSEPGRNYEHLEISRQPKAASSMTDGRVNIPGLQASIPWARRVQEWLEAAGAETSKLSLQQWLEKSIETLEETSSENSRLDLQKWLEGSLRNLQEPNAVQLSTGEWIRASLMTLQEEQLHPTMSAIQDLHRPEGSQQSLHVSMLDWHSETGMDSEEEHLKTPSQPTAPRMVRSIRDLQGEGPGLQSSIPGVRKGASRLRVQEWLELSLRSLEAAGAEASQQSLQQWLEESQRNLDETCPPNSRHDIREWLQASVKNLQEPNAAKLNTEEWIRATLLSLKEECPEVPLRDMVEFLQGSIQDLKEEVSRLSVLEWLEASLRRLQEEDPESTRHDVKEWLESSHRKFRAVSPETSGHYIKKWLERSLRDLHTPHQNLQEYIKESLMRLRAGSYTATRTRQSWLSVPQSTIGARDSSGILKHESSIAPLDRQDVSRTSLISEGNDTDLDYEEAPEISEVFITPEVQPKIVKQRGSKGKGLLDRSVSNTKMLIAKVSSTFFQYRKPFEILLILIPIVLIALAYGHYRRHCSSSGGLPPF